MNITDILLLPKKLYAKLTGKRFTLFIGIILVGLLDLFFSFLEQYQRLFTGKSPVILYFNITLAIVLVILVGFIDVLFFSLPLFDLFKRFKKEKSIINEGDQLVKVMKVYICANLLLLPINALFYFLFKDVVFGDSIGSLITAIMILFLPTFWASAAISRGINVIYDFIHPLKKMVFSIVFIWGTMIALILGYMIDNWFMRIFR